MNDSNVTISTTKNTGHLQYDYSLKSDIGYIEIPISIIKSAQNM
jgi:hypothetical protein